MTIDINKKYRTRDGREVSLHLTDSGGTYPVFGAFKEPDGTWQQATWQANGNYFGTSHKNMDLVDVKPRIKRTFFINIYKNHVGGTCTSKEQADSAASWYTASKRIACAKVEIDCEEGEGL